MQTPVSGLGYSCWPGRPQRPPKQYKLLLSPQRTMFNGKHRGNSFPPRRELEMKPFYCMAMPCRGWKFPPDSRASIFSEITKYSWLNSAETHYLKNDSSLLPISCKWWGDWHMLHHSLKCGLRKAINLCCISSVQFPIIYKFSKRKDMLIQVSLEKQALKVKYFGIQFWLVFVN